MTSTELLGQTGSVYLWGASGMLGGEFLRLLEVHPRLRVRQAVSRGGAEAGALHPHCGRTWDVTTPEEVGADLARTLENGDDPLCVLALPHGESAATWAALRAELGPRADRVRVLDLAADFRLRDPDLYERTYGRPHPDPEELHAFVYGLPEFHGDALRGARRVAAPGCFATAMQLATVPAAAAGLLDPAAPWVLSGVTGSSGSGAAPKPSTHHPHRHGNLWAYATEGHRHEAELEQALTGLDPALAEVPLQFVAHSGPFARGIHLTALLPLAEPCTAKEARAIYAGAFGGHPFVEVLEEGTPDLRSVVGSNRASLAVSVRRGMLCVLVTIDNMIKGGAGQGLQCINLMLGLPETTGLPRSGLGVC